MQNQNFIAWLLGRPELLILLVLDKIGTIGLVHALFDRFIFKTNRRW